MTTIIIMLMAVAILAIAALYWQQQQTGYDQKEIEDGRVTPLLKGINYLLSDEPDLALQEMVQVARLKSEAADVYMALGEMFRAKGEIGRAVRIHQNILARPDVSQELHLQAHLALGKDFQTGGLLDRALKQYEKALTIRSDHIGALEASLRIREQSHEWEEAESLLSQLERIQGDELHLHRAYLLAELAASQVNDNMAGAEKTAKRALELNDTCAHAYIVLTGIYLKKGQVRAAEQMLTEMRNRVGMHLHLLIPTILRHDKFYKSHGYELLMAYWQQTRDEELALSWLESLADSNRDAEARKLSQALDFRPQSLRASLRLAGIEHTDDSQLARHAGIWRKKMKHFICEHCGVKVVELRWQCPQCHSWGTMHAIREEEI